MEEFKIYSVTDNYIEYLRQTVSGVYSNKQDNRTHTRKYVGTVLEMHGFKYYVPMSSPKETDYQVAGYVKSALDFVKLEEMCRNYVRPNSEG